MAIKVVMLSHDDVEDNIRDLDSRVSTMERLAVQAPCNHNWKFVCAKCHVEVETDAL